MEVIHNIPRLALPQVDTKPSRSFKIQRKAGEQELYLEQLARRTFLNDTPGSARTGNDTCLTPSSAEARNTLSRTLSIPFLHSWEFNNIDASSLVCLQFMFVMG